MSPQHPKSKKSDQFLGTLDLRIVGTQYCDVVVIPGENIHLEREHDNRYDSNAIRVKIITIKC